MEKRRFSGRRGLGSLKNAVFRVAEGAAGEKTRFFNSAQPRQVKKWRFLGSRGRGRVKNGVFWVAADSLSRLFACLAGYGFPLSTTTPATAFRAAMRRQTAGTPMSGISNVLGSNAPKHAPTKSAV